MAMENQLEKNMEDAVETARLVEEDHPASGLSAAMGRGTSPEWLQANSSGFRGEWSRVET